MLICVAHVCLVPPEGTVGKVLDSLGVTGGFELPYGTGYWTKSSEQIASS